MSKLRRVLPMLAAILATWVITSASSGLAQSSIPNGVFVQDSRGWLWLVLDGQRVNVPVWLASDDEVLAIPSSEQWAVMNDAGAIVAGDLPTWVQQGGIGGPLTARPRAATASPTPAADRVPIPAMLGQVATSEFGGVPIRAIVREAILTHEIPESIDQLKRTMPPVKASGKFVALRVDVENVGTKAVCCVPPFRLRDANGRIFSDNLGNSDKLRQAMLSLFPTPSRGGDAQPNMSFPYVILFDVPEDAGGFVLIGR
jgi:hypothetical protein